MSQLVETTHQIYPTFDKMGIFESRIKLLQGIVDYKFINPSKIQQKAIVPLATGHDVIAQAQSGSGKTGTFVIGTLAQIDVNNPYPQAIILANTHELADQIAAVAADIGSKMQVKVATCIGRRETVDQNVFKISQGVQLIVGTPGRIDSLVKRRALKLNAIKTIILDEADKLLSDNFLPQVNNIIKRIQTCRNRKQRLQLGIFSATFPEESLKVVQDYTRNPTVFVIPKEKISVKDIIQYKVETNVPRNQSFEIKADLIVSLNSIQTIPQCIIYVNRKDTATKLQEYLADRDLETVAFHGSMEPIDRYQTLKKFRLGHYRILIATDVLARGFDSSNVMLVINFDMPRVIDRKYEDGVRKLKINHQRISEYIHRIGRTGRFGRSGISINLITNNEEKLWMEKIEEFYKVECQELPDNIEELFS